MSLMGGLLLLSGVYPLGRAWQENRGTTLRHALAWAVAAWAVWVVVAWAGYLVPGADLSMPRYLALCLGGCAGVAVLGARRPGVGAWNFVVAGLLAVLLRPVAEGLGELRLTAPHLTILALTLAVGLLNYLPTRLAPVMLLLGLGATVEVPRLAGWELHRAGEVAGLVALGLAPWAGLAAVWGRGRPAGEFDALWLAFRDRFGFVWGQRIREQFNRAAGMAGWPVLLTWHGLRPTTVSVEPGPAQAVATLRAALKRFAAGEDPTAFLRRAGDGRPPPAR